MTTVTLATYEAPDGTLIQFADMDRGACLRGMRLALLDYAKRQGWKRNWFDPTGVRVDELRLGQAVVTPRTVT